SNSSSKSDILRTIFNTQFYRQLADWMKENYKQKEKAVNRQIDQLHQLTEQFQFIQADSQIENQATTSLENWPELFAADLKIQNQQLGNQKNTLQEQYQFQAKLQEQLQQVQELAKQQAEGKKLVARKAQLLENEPEMRNLSQTIEHLKWFVQQKHELEQYEKEQKKFQDYSSNLATTKAQQKDNEAAMQRFDQEQDLRASWQHKLQLAQQQKYQLDELLPIAKDYEEKLQAFGILKAKTTKAFNKLQASEQA